MGGIVGQVTTVVSFFQQFAEDVVAAGASVLNDFLNALAGTAGHDKVINEFSTQNSYFYTDNAYIDNLHNSDEIVLNSLVRGTSLTDEIINFYKKAYSSSDFHLERALDIIDGNDSVHNNAAYTPLSPTIVNDYLEFYSWGADDPHTSNSKVLPSVTLRVNNTNLYAGEAGHTGEHNSSGTGFTWHSVLNNAGNYNTPTALNSTTLGKVQTATKDYLNFLGVPAPETLLDELPYNPHSGTIDSVFINFRVKFVTDSRVSNKYLYKLAEGIDAVAGSPTSLTYTTDSTGIATVDMFTYAIHGDGHNYIMGLSHIVKTEYTNQDTNPHSTYQYDKENISSDGYYYYDAVKSIPTGDHSAKIISEVSTYLTNSGTTEVQANWLEIEQKDQVVVNGVDSVFVDEIDLTGSGITLTSFSHEEPAVPAHRAWTQAAVNALYPYAISEGGVGARLVFEPSWYPNIHNNYHVYVAHVDAYDVYVDAADQVLRVGNLYIKKSTTEIMFATVPATVYSTSSIKYGRSNATSVTYYQVFNVSGVERIVDYAGDSSNSTFRYVTSKLNASNTCVSAPLILGILSKLDPLEQHKLVLASANMSMHLAHYERIEKTWEQKARAATLEVVRVGAIIFSISSMGTSGSLVVLAESIIVAYATSLAVNTFIEQILVPVIVSNFGEDEALILLAVAAVAIAIYSSKSGTAGLNQFSNQATLFTASIDIMNQMYSLAVVEPGLLEMQKEQEEWTKTDNELTEKEEEFQENYEAIFGTEDSSSHLLNLQIRAALNPMPASAYFGYHDGMLERQFDCFDYEKYNELNVS